VLLRCHRPSLLLWLERPLSGWTLDRDHHSTAAMRASGNLRLCSVGRRFGALGFAVVLVAVSVGCGPGGSQKGGPSDVVPADGHAPPGADTSITTSGEVGTAASCPAPGTPCQGVQRCSFGDTLDVGCRTQLICTNGRWTVESQRSGCGAGTSPCPAAAAAVGSSCPLAGQFCAYPGRSCACSVGCASGAPEPNCQPHAPTWSCEDNSRQPGCPPQPPQSGDACSVADTWCWYTAACKSQVARCEAGRWSVMYDQPGCP
jgi:hypothetical protein